MTSGVRAQPDGSPATRALAVEAVDGFVLAAVRAVAFCDSLDDASAHGTGDALTAVSHPDRRRNDPAHSFRVESILPCSISFVLLSLQFDLLFFLNLLHFFLFEMG